MSVKSKSPFKAGSSTLWVVLTAVAYLVLWKTILHWTGKWPAPYWFAVGLSVLIVGGLFRVKSVHFIWLVPMACFAGLVAWFFSLGIYGTWARTLIFHDYRWYYQNWWPEKVPVIAVMATLVTCLSLPARPRRTIRFCVAILLFVAAFFGLLVLAEPLCSSYLPRAGTTFHGDYDVFGFRLGGYFLLAILTSVALLRLMLPKPMEAHDGDQGSVEFSASRFALKWRQ